jgi:phospho-N-acetylmuramoyl-pentapeptide-transferase
MEILSINNIFPIVKALSLGALAFIIAMLWTPALIWFLEKYHLGKQIRKKGAPIFYKLHKQKQGTPTMAGVLVWGTTLLIAGGIWLLSQMSGHPFWEALNFLNRPETLLPLGALVFAALIGLADDLFGVLGRGPKGGGISIGAKLILYTFIATLGAWWFFFKLDWDLLYIPFFGSLNIGAWYIPAFILIIVATAFSTNEADGLDGLAGGLLLIGFAALAVVAFIQGRFNLVVFLAVIIGSLLAFLWHNIYPARFFMGDTGSMGLGVTLGVIAMLTNSALLLPFFGLMLVVESGSVILQVASKKFRGKKIFLSTPIHHHFEALGWHPSRVTMRFWLLGTIGASIGIVLALISYALFPICPPGGCL